MKKIVINKAFSIAEMLVALAIVAIVGVTAVFAVKQQAEKQYQRSEHGTFICYKDSNGNLHQVITILYPSGKKTVEKKSNISACVYDFPKRKVTYTVRAIGGGGGGAGVNKVELANSYGGSYTSGEVDLSHLCKTVDHSSIGYTEYAATSGEFNSSDSSYYSFNYSETPSYKKAAKNINDMYIEINSSIFGENFSRYLSNLSSNAEIEKYILPHIPLIKVKSGNGFTYQTSTNTAVNSTNGYVATLDNNYSKELRFGDKILCVSGANAKVNKSVFAPGAALIYIKDKNDNFKVKAKIQGGKFKIDGGDSREFNTNDFAIDNDPRCIGGLSADCSKLNLIPSADAITNKVSYRISIYPKSYIYLYYGTGGLRGEMLERETDSLSGKTLRIEKDQIGNGGKGGECKTGDADSACKGNNGTKTCFKTPDSNTCSLAALGGYGGNMPADYTQAYQYPTYHSNVINQFREVKFSETDKPAMRGETSPISKDDTDKGNGGKGGECVFNSTKNAHDCTKAGSPDEKYFGAGGGGASSAAYYKNIPKSLSLTINATKIYDNIPLTDNYVQNNSFGTGGNGMGGAIVVEW